MDWAYRGFRLIGRFIYFCTVRAEIVRPGSADREGPYLIACTHMGHLDPFFVGTIVRRRIDWITREEFFRRPYFAWTLRQLNAVKIRRFGVAASAIRTSIDRLNRGRVVGICPEGGVCRGAQSVTRGAPIKRGVCLISYRTGAPVVPCVILGSEELDRVRPWLPFKRIRLRVAFADRPVRPRRDLDRRAAREWMARQLEREYVKLYEELRGTCHSEKEVHPSAV